jgi:hypothetical protein
MMHRNKEQVLDGKNAEMPVAWAFFRVVARACLFCQQIRPPA